MKAIASFFSFDALQGALVPAIILAVLVICAVIAMICGRKRFGAWFEVAGKYSHLLRNLIGRDLKVKYRRSVLGFLWSVLNPLLMSLVIAAVFKNLFRYEIEHFIVYYLTGSLIFNFMVESTTNSLTSVLNSASLIKKVYVPKYIFPIEKCMFAFVNMLFSMLALIVVIILDGVKLSPTMLLFLVPMLYTLIFSVGLSLLLAAINVFFRDVGHLYGVWVTAWMYFTPIIYPASILPEWVLRFMRFNPMYYYTDYFRQLVLYGTLPDLNTNLCCAAFSLGFLLVGLWAFKSKQDKFILYI